eukprot:scaffold516_cov401-Prasinococcus_capsulatus_cf.AAC.12
MVVARSCSTNRGTSSRSPTDLAIYTIVHKESYICTWDRQACWPAQPNQFQFGCVLERQGQRPLSLSTRGIEQSIPPITLVPCRFLAIVARVPRAMAASRAGRLPTEPRPAYACACTARWRRRRAVARRPGIHVEASSTVHVHVRGDQSARGGATAIGLGVKTLGTRATTSRRLVDWPAIHHRDMSLCMCARAQRALVESEGARVQVPLPALPSADLSSLPLPEVVCQPQPDRRRRVVSFLGNEAMSISVEEQIDE